MDFLQIGDKVKIIHSDYDCVKVGTIAIIKEIRKTWHKKYKMLTLDLPNCTHFWDFEIEKLERRID
jgi:hypothetical protein